MELFRVKILFFFTGGLKKYITRQRRRYLSLVATGNVVTVDASCEWPVSAGKGKMPGPVNITNYNNNATGQILRFYFV